MATVIKTIEDFFHNKVYPKTKTKAVYDDDNNRLDNILASKQDINSNFVYKGTGSATPSIDDPELRQSDISTTQSTSDITVPSSSLVKTMNDNLGNPSSASSVTGADAFSKISTLNSDLTPQVFNITPATGYTTTSMTHCQKQGNIVELRIELSFANSTATTFGEVATVPAGYRPSTVAPLLCIDSTNDKVITAFVRTNGVITVYRDYTTNMNVMKLEGMFFVT